MLCQSRTKSSSFVLKKDSYAYHMMNLMDFNKSFLSYDTLDGARCQTCARRISQKEAALEAVCTVGVNQVAKVGAEWFARPEIREMFFRRLETVKAVLDRPVLIWILF